MTPFEDFALGSFLSYANPNKTYDEIIEALQHVACDCPGNDNEEIACALCDTLEEIEIWEPFENHEPYWVAEHIETMRENLEHHFIPFNNREVLV